MKSQTLFLFSLRVVCAGALVSGAFAQGPLPPPGAASLPFADRALDGTGSPTPSMKTLTQTDPGQPLPSRDVNQPALNGTLAQYIITKPGHYYLTENLTGIKPVVIDADDVTLDLRGHLIRLEAPAGAPPSTVAAVDTTSGPVVRKNVTVRNGHVSGAWLIGVKLGPDSRALDLQVSGVQTYGVKCDEAALIERCVVSVETQPQNPLGGPVGAGPWAGIYAEGASVIRACQAHGVLAIGILGQKSSRIVDSIAAGCAGCGIVANTGASLSGCTVLKNGVTGIDVSAGTTILNCSALENGGEGFHLRGGCTLTGCTSRQNKEEGFYAEPMMYPGYFESNNATSFLQCVAQLNAWDGFHTTDNCLFTHCTADKNGSPPPAPGSPAPPLSGTNHGFNVGDGNQFLNCISIGNLADGYKAGLQNRIEGCTARGNGGWGIEVTNNQNVVIRNFVRTNTLGNINAPAGNGVAATDLPSNPGVSPLANLSY